MNSVFEFAGVSVSAEYSYDYLEKQCRSYISEKTADIGISVKKSDIEYERDLSGTKYSDGYLESLAFYRSFVTASADFNVLLMHGSAIRFNGKAYIFTAPSGTGKSTHSKLCIDAFGDRTDYINDDKPLLRFDEKNGNWSVFGTPWDGKHHLSQNISAPLGGICFLDRGEVNSIEKVIDNDSFPELFLRIFRPSDPQHMQKVLDLAVILSQTAQWKLKCNISKEAAVLSLGTMSQIQEK